MTIDMISKMGGVFSLLVFYHFLSDWVFQSHAEALAKAKDSRVRFWHCVKYTLPFNLIFLFVGMTPFSLLVSLTILFVSHYIIDSYVPVMLWAKHLRKAPQFKDGVNDMDAFKEFASTPIGLVLMITMDQFFHIAFLLPVAYLIVRG